MRPTARVWDRAAASSEAETCSLDQCVHAGGAAERMRGRGGVRAAAMKALSGLPRSLPRIDARSKDCVRFLRKERRYELVVGGEVKASISSFAMTVPAARRKFDQAVRQAAREKQIDDQVERLFRDEPLRGADALRANATEQTVDENQDS